MARIVLVYGNSGSGKSTSLRNFKPDEISIFNVTNKELPFRGGNKIPIKHNSTYDDIASGLMNPKKKAYIIDDVGYLLSFSALRRASEKGYDKWNEMGESFFKMLEFITTDVPNDVVVYMFMHEDIDDNGNVRAKTIGKMIDNTLFLEGLFTIVLRSVHNERGYKFITHGEINSTVKTPLDMFGEDEIDNDLKAVDEVIRGYYEMKPLGVKSGKKTEKE